MGLHLTLSDTNSKLDPELLAIAANVNPTIAKEFGKVWDLFGQRLAPITTDEFIVLARQYTAPEVVVTASGTGASDWNSASDTTALPVSSGTIDRITIGDVLMVEDEVVVVKSVDRTGNTIDVYERGAGETDGAAHGTGAITALVIGNANVEGKVDGEAMAEGTDKFTNYTQLVEEIIDLSLADSEQNRKLGRTEPILKGESLVRNMRDMARTSIHGVSRAPTAAIPSMTRGLRQWLKLSGGLRTSVGAAFDETKLKAGLAKVRAAGGTPNAIVLSVAKKTLANAFTGGVQVVQPTDNRTAGRVVNAYLADGFGEIPFVVDLDWPDDEVAIIDSNKLTKGWKVGDALRFSPFTNVHPRENKTLLHGRYGTAVENVGQSHCLLEDLS